MYDIIIPNKNLTSLSRLIYNQSVTHLKKFKKKLKNFCLFKKFIWEIFFFLLKSYIFYNKFIYFFSLKILQENELSVNLEKTEEKEIRKIKNLK